MSDERPKMPPGRQRFSMFHRSNDQDADLRAWHHAYAEALAPCERVLDFGCGTGIFLEMMRERGISGLGIDRDPEMVEQTRARGLDAIAGDATSLDAYAAEFGGIHVAHVLETMWGEEVIAFLERCKRALRPDGILLLRTWNWENADVRDRTFWLEITHKRPYSMSTLREVLTDLGMHVVGAGYEPSGQQDCYLMARAPAGTPARITTNGKPLVVWEGELQTLNSMSIINREVGAVLARSDAIQIAFRPDEVQPDPLVIDDPRYAEVRARIERAPLQSDLFVRHPCGDPSFERPPTKTYVHIQPWEYGALPSRWVEGMKPTVDEVWCPTSYVRDLYLAAGFAPEKLAVVPNGFDPDVFKPGPATANVGTAKGFKFLFVGGTLERKGIDVLIDAYLHAFGPDDDVSLIIKDFGLGGFYRLVSYREKIFEIQKRPHIPEIVYTDADLSTGQLVALYQSVDCFAFPYRGEGFGMPMLEAMACGLPVIATAGGAADDFLDDSTAYRIPAKRRSIGRTVHTIKLIDEGWILDPDKNALANTMRHIYENREEARQVGIRATERAHKNFTWDHVGAIALERIRRHVG